MDPKPQKEGDAPPRRRNVEILDHEEAPQRSWGEAVMSVTTPAQEVLKTFAWAGLAGVAVATFVQVVRGRGVVAVGAVTPVTPSSPATTTTTSTPTTGG
jgi:hypothetical protein